ncbi:MAG: hypothetical protein ACFCVK_25325 [Acidimicrobiales bacterium]
MRRCSYGPDPLDELETKEWETTRGEDAEAFVNLFGPDKIPGQAGRDGHQEAVGVAGSQRPHHQCLRTGTIALVAGEWRFVELGNVYP